MRIVFRNPHEIKHQLGRELSHRICRRDVDRRVSCRLNTDWSAQKEWEVSPLFMLPAGLEAAFEVHCPAVSNSSVGLHGIEAQTAGNNINLRSSNKMTLGKGGWVEGCITVPL